MGWNHLSLSEGRAATTMQEILDAHSILSRADEMIKQRMHIASGPRLPTWALQQVGSYRGYTGYQINIVAAAAGGPMRSNGGPANAVPPTRQNLRAEVLGLTDLETTEGPGSDSRSLT